MFYKRKNPQLQGFAGSGDVIGVETVVTALLSELALSEIVVPLAGGTSVAVTLFDGTTVPFAATEETSPAFSGVATEEEFPEFVSGDGTTVVVVVF